MARSIATAAIFVTALLAAAAHGQNAGPGSATGQNRSRTIGIDYAACLLLAQNADGAGVDYVPGIDVDGDPVAPADLPGGQNIVAPTRFVVPITESLSRQLGVGSGSGEKAYVGVITVGDGKLAFNGQPIGDVANAEIARLCAMRWRPKGAKNGGGGR